MELFKIFGTVGCKVDEASENLDTITNKAKNTSVAIGTKFQNVGNTIQGVGQKFKGMSVVATGALTLSAKQASDFEENINKVDVAFGKNSNEVKRWANTATQQFGLSKNAALEMTAQFGDMGTSMGLTQSEASKMSMSMAGLAGDLASFKNISTDQAMTALNGVFTGETESLKTLGIVMTQTNLEKFASDTGKVYKEMSEAEKVQLRYNYVMAQTKNAQGDYAKTSDGTANSIRTFQSSLENLAVTFGQYVLPVITPFVQKASQLVQKFSELPPNVQKVIVAVGGAVAVFAPVMSVVGRMVSGIGSLITTVTKVGSAFSRLFSMLMANPIGLVITAISALVAGFIYLWNNCESFRTFWINLWNKIKSVVAPVVNAIRNTVVTVFNAIKNVVVPLWNGIKNTIVNVWTKIKTSVSTAVNAVKNTVSRVFNAVKTVVSTVWNGIKTAVTTPIHAIKTAVSTVFNAVRNTISRVFNGIKNTASTVWNGIKNAITKPIQTAKDVVTGVVEKIKGFFPLKLGKIFSGFKLPHFKISGGKAPFGLLGKGQMPKFSVDWYKKAMDNPYMFTEPTVFDYNPLSGAKVAGEAGNEMMYGHSNLMRDIEEAVGNGSTDNSGIEQLVSALFNWMQSPNGFAKMITNVLTENVRFMLDDRQVGKVIKGYVG